MRPTDQRVLRDARAEHERDDEQNGHFDANAGVGPRLFYPGLSEAATVFTTLNTIEPRRVDTNAYRSFCAFLMNVPFEVQLQRIRKDS